MEYGFDIDEAIQFGLNEAIMLKNLKFWIAKNKSNDKHFYDGRTWTYNSVKSFKELFPFWSKGQIERILLSLKNKGIIITGNYNKLRFDRTVWYAFDDENRFMHFLKTGNEISQKQEMRFPENEKPIPDNNTDTKTDNKHIEDFSADFEEWYELYPNKKSKSLAKKSYEKVRQSGITKEKLIEGARKYTTFIQANNKETKYIKHPSTWLNQGCWDDEYTEIKKKNSMLF